MCQSALLSILIVSWLVIESISPVHAEKRVFSIGVEDYENWLPYSQFKNGEYGGLGKDILDLFAQEKGYVFRYETYPLKRRDLKFVSKEVDLAFPDNPNWVTDLKKGLEIQYAPMLEFTDGVIVITENRGRDIQRLKTLGVPLGFSPYQYFEDIRVGRIKRYDFPNFDGLYDKVVLGDIDGAYMNIGIANYYYMDRANEKNQLIMFDPSLPHVKGYWHLSSIKYPEVVKEFDQFMKKNQKAISRLKNKYGFW